MNRKSLKYIFAATPFFFSVMYSESPAASLDNHAPRHPSATRQTIATQNLWVVGDSYGVGLSDNGRAINAKAIQGKTISAITKQLEGVPQGSTIIVCGGTNDANGNYSDAKLRKDAERLIKEARNRNLTIGAWIGPTTVDKNSVYSKSNPRFSENLSRADKILKSLMEEYHIPYISLHKSPYVQLNKSDGLHYNNKGFAILRENIKAILILPTKPSALSLQPK